MSEKKIRISLEDNVSSGMQRIGDASAKSLGKVAESYENIDEVIDGLIQDSSKYNLSIQDRIKWIEKEIQAQGRNSKIDFTERRNKIDHEKRLGEEKKRWSKHDEDGYKNKKRRLIDEQKEEQLYQSKLRAGFEEKKRQLTEEEKQKNREQGVVLASAASSDDDDDDKKPGIVRRTGRRVGKMARSAGNAALAAAGFGAVLSIGGFVGKMIDEAKSLDEARARQTGATGKQITGGYAYGLKESALMDYATSVAKASGSSVGAGQNARDQLAIEKGMGMEIGSMTGFNKVMRASDQTLVDSTVDMLNIMKKSDLYNIKRGDFTQMHELLEKQNALNEMQASQMEEVDARQSSLLMASMGKVGGSFGDFRQGQTMQSMNQAITSPDNDFKQAFLLRTLRKQDPNASFLDLKMKQEEGIFGKGTLNNIMSELTKSFSGDQLTFSTSKMLGLNLSQAKRMTDYYKENPEGFSNMNFTSEEEFKKFASDGGFSKKSLRQRGAAHTGTIEGWQSQFDTWMGHKGDAAVGYVQKLQGSYEKGGFGGVMKQMGSDIVDAIKEGFSQAIGGTEAAKKFGLKGLTTASDEETMTDVEEALKNVPEAELKKYKDPILAYKKRKEGVKDSPFSPTTAVDMFQELTNTGTTGDFNDAVKELLTKFGGGKYVEEEGKLMKVEVTNMPKEKVKQKVNEPYKTEDN